MKEIVKKGVGIFLRVDIFWEITVQQIIIEGKEIEIQQD